MGGGTLPGVTLPTFALALPPGDPDAVAHAADVRLEDLKAAHVKSLADVRDEIEKIVREQNRTKTQEEWVKQLRAKAYIRTF